VGANVLLEPVHYLLVYHRWVRSALTDIYLKKNAIHEYRRKEIMTL